MSRGWRTATVVLVLVGLPLLVMGGGAAWFWWQVVQTARRA